MEYVVTGLTMLDKIAVNGQNVSESQRYLTLGFRIMKFRMKE